MENQFGVQLMGGNPSNMRFSTTHPNTSYVEKPAPGQGSIVSHGTLHDLPPKNLGLENGCQFWFRWQFMPMPLAKFSENSNLHFEITFGKVGFLPTSLGVSNKPLLRMDAHSPLSLDAIFKNKNGPHYTYLEIEWNWYESYPRYSHWIFALHQMYRQIKLFVREEKPTYVFIHRRNIVLEIVDFTTILSTKHIAAQIRWFFLQQLSNSFQSVEWALNNCGSHSHFMPYIFWGGEGEKQKASALTLMVRKHTPKSSTKISRLTADAKNVEASMVTSPQNFHVQVKSTW